MLQKSWQTNHLKYIKTLSTLGWTNNELMNWFRILFISDDCIERAELQIYIVCMCVQNLFQNMHETSEQILCSDLSLLLSNALTLQT